MKKLLSVSLAFCILLSVFAHTAIAVEETESPLIYSTSVSWDYDTMNYYNCYAYAIGRTDDVYHPGSSPMHRNMTVQI